MRACDEAIYVCVRVLCMRMRKHVYIRDKQTTTTTTTTLRSMTCGIKLTLIKENKIFYMVDVVKLNRRELIKIMRTVEKKNRFFWPQIGLGKFCKSSTE